MWRNVPGHLRAAVSAVVLVVLLAHTDSAHSAGAGQARKIPGKRLANGVYTSPNAEYTLDFKGLMLPGMHAQEQQLDLNTSAVMIATDFGGAFGVIRTAGAPESLTVERISQDFTEDATLLDKHIIGTPHGPELRFLGILRGGSPVVTQKQDGKHMVETRNDLIQAWSIFRDHAAVYRLSAGLTPFMGESDSVMCERAKGKLDVLLAGLAIRP